MSNHPPKPRRSGGASPFPTPSVRPGCQTDVAQTTPPEEPVEQPAEQAADTDYTPTPEELREIVAFLRARSLDEAGAAGMMTSFRESGVTVQVNIPDDAFAASYTDVVHRKANGWMDEHSPDRFVELASGIAELGDALANAGLDAISQTMANPYLGAYRQQRVWQHLTRAARLWITHPDFKPLWAEGD